MLIITSRRMSFGGRGCEDSLRYILIRHECCIIHTSCGVWSSGDFPGHDDHFWSRESPSTTVARSFPGDVVASSAWQAGACRVSLRDKRELFDGLVSDGRKEGTFLVVKKRRRGVLPRKIIRHDPCLPSLLLPPSKVQYRLS
jgi:hypothetical protein